jgi:hypothetical protein
VPQRVPADDRTRRAGTPLYIPRAETPLANLFVQATRSPSPEAEGAERAGRSETNRWIIVKMVYIYKYGKNRIVSTARRGGRPALSLLGDRGSPSPLRSFVSSVRLKDDASA